MVVTRPRQGLLALRAAVGPRSRDPEVASLGLAIILDDEPTNPDRSIVGVEVDDATTAYEADVRQRRMFECAARARDRFAAVRPALARLRSLLPRRQGDGSDRDLIVLAAADVARGLVQARRSMRALAAELADLEAESRDVLAVAARIEAGP